MIGLIVVAIGVGIIGNAVGIWNFTIFFKGWWALALMLAFLCGIISEGPRLLNVLGLVIFGALFAKNYISILADVNIWLIVAGAAVLVVGLRLIFGVFLPRSEKTDAAHDTSSADGGYVGEGGNCAFSSCRTSYAGRTFSGGKFSCAFGEYVVDLCGATITEGAVLKADCAFGSIKIVLDSGTKVALKKDTCFGSVSFDGTESDVADITVKAECSFGSVKIIQK